MLKLGVRVPPLGPPCAFRTLTSFLFFSLSRGRRDKFPFLSYANLTFKKIYSIIYIESEGNKMKFDDFDTQQQSDEIIPEEYDDWMCFVYSLVLSSNGKDARFSIS